MARIRSKGNKTTEHRLLLHFKTARIIGWRHGYALPGLPDFVFPSLRLAVFVDGCFWHGCPVHYKRPKTRQKYWDAKVAKNRARDRAIVLLIKRNGWRVVRVWEHEVRKALPARIKSAILKRAVSANRPN
ncbi:MAG: very short patch repair endonuclease [Opitutaceae bacterium]